MQRQGNNIAEDILLNWLDVEKYMVQFKEGNFENYDKCQEIIQHLAVKNLQLAIDKCQEQGVPINIPAFVVNR